MLRRLSSIIPRRPSFPGFRPLFPALARRLSCMRCPCAPGINVTSLPNGTLTFSVTLTDAFDDVGTAVTAMATLNATI
jgi:hypothetical protein